MTALKIQVLLTAKSSKGCMHGRESFGLANAKSSCVLISKTLGIP